MNLSDLLRKATETAYPEPDTPLHCNIIPQVVPVFARYCAPPARVLDIGCGSCFGAKELRKAGYDVTPISVLADEVTAARVEGFPAVKCEMHDTELMGKFDAVWLRHAAEHSPAPLLLLCNLFEQARWLYLEVPMPETSCHHETNPNHYSCLAKLGWANLLLAAGWTIVHTQTIGIALPDGPDEYAFFICTHE